MHDDVRRCEAGGHPPGPAHPQAAVVALRERIAGEADEIERALHLVNAVVRRGAEVEQRARVVLGVRGHVRHVRHAQEQRERQGRLVERREHDGGGNAAPQEAREREHVDGRHRLGLRVDPGRRPLDDLADAGEQLRRRSPARSA
jgi:hypothetical protein